MSQPGRLREAITTAALHNPVDSGFKVNLMTYRDINRLHSELGAQVYPYNLTLIYYLSIATWLSAWRFMCTA